MNYSKLYFYPRLALFLIVKLMTMGVNGLFMIRVHVLFKCSQLNLS